jgi:hypothetical protein
MSGEYAWGKVSRQEGLRELTPMFYHVCLGFIVYIIIVIRFMAIKTGSLAHPIVRCA